MNTCRLTSSVKMGAPEPSYIHVQGNEDHVSFFSVHFPMSHCFMDIWCVAAQKQVLAHYEVQNMLHNYRSVVTLARVMENECTTVGYIQF